MRFTPIKPHYFFILVLFQCSFCLLNTTLANPISLVDASGQKIELKKPAQRIISLSPGLTELVHSAGAFEQLVGVVSFSDFPPKAKQLPIIGSYHALDLEKILSLKPDLILAWQSGNPMGQIKQLQRLGFQIYLSEPKSFDDIASQIKHIGILTGHQKTAEHQATRFLEQIRALEQKYKGQKPIKVFVQIWNKPVMTIGGNHLISKLIQLCGGINIFSEQNQLSLTPNMESIISKKPQVIFSTGMAEMSQEWLARWQQWQQIPAVKQDKLYSVNPDHVVRHTPRLILGAKQVCKYLARARD